MSKRELISPNGDKRLIRRDEQGRIRRHIRIFFDGEQVRDLAQPLRADGELIIVQALSGG